MRWTSLLRADCFVIVMVFAAWPCLSPLEAAEAPVSDNRVQIYLSPSAGATPLSTVVEAQARYVSAAGSYLESAAIARRINAEAFSMELDNWNKAVNTYFKNREDWRQWMAKEHPDFHNREKKIQSVLKEQMHDYGEHLAGDQTTRLNWLLKELTEPAAAFRYLSKQERQEAFGEFDIGLVADAPNHIWLTDGGQRGRKLHFRASDGKPMSEPWPYVLCEPAFEPERDSFESARDRVLNDISKNRRPSSEAGANLLAAVDALSGVLERVYPRERRAEPQVFVDYLSGRSYLETLKSQSKRTLETNDRAALEGGLKFEGTSVLDLVQHMHRNGLVFDRPRPGDERVYDSLYAAMRNLWLVLCADPPPAEPSAARPDSNRSEQ